MDSFTLIMISLVGIALLILLFLILREFFCWYWKVNELIVLQNKQLEALNIIIEKLTKN
jgi:hypothetical protein